MEYSRKTQKMWSDSQLEMFESVLPVETHHGGSGGLIGAHSPPPAAGITSIFQAWV